MKYIYLILIDINEYYLVVNNGYFLCPPCFHHVPTPMKTFNYQKYTVNCLPLYEYNVPLSPLFQAQIDSLTKKLSRKDTSSYERDTLAVILTQIQQQLQQQQLQQQLNKNEQGKEDHQPHFVGKVCIS